MRDVIISLVVVLGTLTLIGCRGEKIIPPVHGDVLQKAGLQYYWRLKLGLSKKETVTWTIQLDENLYCLTSTNRLITIDAATGLMKWSHQVANKNQMVFPVAHADNMLLGEKVAGLKEILSGATDENLTPFDAVLVNTLSYVLIMDRANGRVYRKIPFDFPANTTGASDGTYFYVGSTRGWYYAMKLREAAKVWWLDAHDMIAAPLKYHDGRIYVATEGGSLIATDVTQRGTKLWTKKLGGAVTAEFHVDSRGCFVGCDDQRIYAFDPATGDALWEPFIAQAPLCDPIHVGENTVFQLARGDKFYAIDLTTGKERWSHRDARKILGVFNGNVYLLTAARSLLIVDEMLGTVKTSLPLSGWELFAGNVSSPGIYVATRRGDLGCIRTTGAEYITPEMLK